MTKHIYGKAAFCFQYRIQKHRMHAERCIYSGFPRFLSEQSYFYHKLGKHLTTDWLYFLNVSVRVAV